MEELTTINPLSPLDLSIPRDKSVFFVSLGCSKNLVDGQVMLGYLGLDGFGVTKVPEMADVIVVNTCSFIEASKNESIEAILNYADYKNPEIGKCHTLVVSGCLSQRYSQELEEGLPEVDLFIGTGEYSKIALLLKARAEGSLEKKSFVEIPKFIHTEFDPRINTSPFYMAWLKVSEGCNRNCSFCIIPKIRGKLRSRSVESLVNEARTLAKNGVKELNLISQDLSHFGRNTVEGGEIESDRENLYQLLLGLQEIEGIKWIRLFYLYPDDLDDRVIDLMAKSEKICSYLDMPVQHFSDSVLKRMNRKITGKEIFEKIERIRSAIPNIVLRTSIIVGFPGETVEDFNLLLDGVKKARFNHLGIFKYSDEEGTPAFKLKPKVDPEIIEERFQKLVRVQTKIAKESNKKFIGQELEVLIEGHHEETDLLIKGRHSGQAPEIDGNVIINDTDIFDLTEGELVLVRISSAFDFDLVGKVIRKI